MSSSMKIAAGIFALLLLYFGVRTFFGNEAGSSTDVPVAEADAVPFMERPVPQKSGGKDGSRVLVRKSVAQDRTIYLTLKGRSEPERTVTVRSETTGVVALTPAEEGQAVEKNDILCGLEVEGRVARLNEAKANVASAELVYNQNVELVKGGWKSPNQEAAAKAALDGTLAALESAKIELEKTKIRAPFAGVFERRTAEVGDFLAPGGACGVLLDMDPLIIAADVSEKYASSLIKGSAARAKLKGAQEEVAGYVKYVASSSDPVTRTYRVEIALDNPGMKTPSGMSAEVRVQVGQGTAHLISPALIVYDDKGAAGVRYVGVGGIVQMAQVEVVDTDPNGVWVSGLPSEAQIIVEGQGYVRAGAQVQPVLEGESS